MIDLTSRNNKRIRCLGFYVRVLVLIGRKFRVLVLIGRDGEGLTETNWAFTFVGSRKSSCKAQTKFLILLGRSRMSDRALYFEELRHDEWVGEVGGGVRS